ncbi:MAG: hypothetical protein ACJAR2_003395 [Ilumatobacter sp.]|jgi:hypothetical protein
MRATVRSNDECTVGTTPNHEVFCQQADGVGTVSDIRHLRNRVPRGAKCGVVYK